MLFFHLLLIHHSPTILKIMSWGWKIAILYSGFVIMILTFVVASTRIDFHLVTEDYYAEEIAYQERIDRTNAALALDDPMEIRLLKAEQKVEIEFPEGQSPSGEILLYSPTNSREDRTFEVAPNSEQVQNISLKGLRTGLWKVQILWEDAGVKYYKEKVIIL